MKRYLLLNKREATLKLEKIEDDTKQSQDSVISFRPTNLPNKYFDCGSYKLLILKGYMLSGYGLWP